MSKVQRIRKLMLGPSEKITARNSVVGNMCIADYVVDGCRYLVFERAETAERKPRTKPNSKPAAKQDAQVAVV